MTPSNSFSSPWIVAALVAAGLAAGPLRGLAADSTTASVSFADPSKPCLLKVYVSNGDLTVHPGDSASQVTVTSTAKPSEDPTQRKDGLRVLSASSSGFTLKVEGNVATLDYGRESWPHDGGAKFDIAVPKSTNLEIQNGWGGSVALDRLSGDVAVKALNCGVKGTGLAGGLSVETMNGGIHVAFSALSKEHPISISSMNGAVVVRVPADAKAQVRFRTHNGSILTDFSDAALKTTSQNLGETGWASVVSQNAVVAAHVAGEVGREIAERAREMGEQMREAARQAAEAQDAGAAKGTQPPIPAAHPRAPMPPLPPNIPAIAGGKVVSGDLNGGGVLLQVTTMNGDITLRHE